MRSVPNVRVEHTSFGELTLGFLEWRCAE